MGKYLVWAFRTEVVRFRTTGNGKEPAPGASGIYILHIGAAATSVISALDTKLPHFRIKGLRIELKQLGCSPGTTHPAAAFA